MLPKKKSLADVRVVYCLGDLQTVCDGVRDLRLREVCGGVLRAIAGLVAVACDCALASRLAIRALRRFFVLLAVPSRFCSSASIKSITAIGVGGSYCPAAPVVAKLTILADRIVDRRR
jgi:hypothetical protein